MNKRNSGKITSLPKAKKWSTTGIISCSSRVSLAYNESRHDSYSQFPRSLLATPGSPTSLLCPKYEEEIRRADYDSRCYATSSNKSHPVWLAVLDQTRRSWSSKWWLHVHLGAATLEPECYGPPQRKISKEYTNVRIALVKGLREDVEKINKSVGGRISRKCKLVNIKSVADVIQKAKQCKALHDLSKGSVSEIWHSSCSTDFGREHFGNETTSVWGVRAHNFESSMRCRWPC